MFMSRLLKLNKFLNINSLSHGRLRYFSSSKHWLKLESENASHQNLPHNEESQDDTEEILDIYKERLKYSELLEAQKDEEENRFKGLNLSRGIFGVFDIEDLVDTLRHQNAEAIFVASVPKDIKYVDYIVIVSGRSQRHMQAMMQFVRRVYKQKHHQNDIVPTTEGANSPDWMAIDLGNIALHIFSRKARLLYDLDSLWAVGPKYDEECNKEEAVSSMLNKHAMYLEGLEPAS